MPSPPTTVKRSDKRQPDGELPFTVQDLRRVIPAHCFKRSYVRSLAWLAHDIFLHGCFLYLAIRYLHGNPWLDNVITWMIYAAVAGSQLTGLWVLAHECGHGAFSDSPILNDIVGFFAHSYLLAPYFAWQYSHGVHHRRTNHMTEGETHIPNTLTEARSAGWIRLQMYRYLPAWLAKGITVSVFLFLGWPLYLFFHITGSPEMKARGATHFTVDPLFPKKIAWKIHLGSLGLLGALGIAAYCSWLCGFLTVLKIWGGPVLVVFAYLIGITYIHHSHPDVPHYRKASWTWLKGALSTVDADYGWVLDWWQHDIGRTHLCHHLFSDLPFYHSREATLHIKRFIKEKGCGHLLVEEPHPFKALFNNQYDCWYVDDHGEKIYYNTLWDFIEHEVED